MLGALELKGLTALDENKTDAPVIKLKRQRASEPLKTDDIKPLKPSNQDVKTGDIFDNYGRAPITRPSHLKFEGTTESTDNEPPLPPDPNTAPQNPAGESQISGDSITDNGIAENNISEIPEPRESPMEDATDSLQSEDHIEQNKFYSKRIILDRVNNSCTLRGRFSRQNRDRPPILLVHNFAETPRDYLPFINMMFESGYNIFIYSQRGQRSKRIAHLSRYQTLVKDMLQVVNWINKISSKHKTVVVGHHLSTILIQNFAVNCANYLRGIVLISPIAERYSEIMPLQRWIIHMLADITPKKALPAVLVPKIIFSRRLRQNQDDLPQQVSARYVHEIIKSLKHGYIQLVRIKTKMLILQTYSGENQNHFYRKLIDKKNNSNRYSLIERESLEANLLTSDQTDLTYVQEELVNWLKNMIT